VLEELTRIMRVGSATRLWTADLRELVYFWEPARPLCMALSFCY
jgi:hypothetical protein